MAQLAVAFAAPSLLGSLFKFGLFAASVAGSFLMPDQKAGNTQKLNDLKVSSSAYGQGIAILYGTMRVPGNMFWATPFREVKRPANKQTKKGKSRKKGGGKYYYEYYANFAMGFCEGPAQEVLRIWADSNLIYDKYNKDDDKVVGPGFSQDRDGNSGGKGKGGITGKSSGGDSGRFNFRFYPGTEEQMPDRFMQARTGSDKQPAHRGLCYIVFEDFSLTDFGNRVPTITAEITRFAVRKPFVTHFTQKISEPKADRDDGMMYGFVDYFRKNIITQTAGDGRKIRNFSLINKKEVSIVDLRPALSKSKGWSTWFNGEYVSPKITDVPEVLGPTHTGEIAVRTTISNSIPVYILDPLRPQATIGLGSDGRGPLRPNRYSLGPASQSIVIPYMTKGGLVYVTGITSLFGGWTFFSKGSWGNWTPLGYMNNDDNSQLDDRNYWNLFAGPPLEKGKTAIYYQEDGRIQKLETKMEGTNFLYLKGIDDNWYSTGTWVDHNNPQRIPNDMIQPPSGKYGGKTIFDAGSGNISATKAVAMLGPRCIAFLYVKNDKLYAVKIDAQSDKVLWHEEISHWGRPIPGRFNNLIQPPIIGNNYVIRADDVAFSVNFAKQSMEVIQLPSGLPATGEGSLYYSPQNMILSYSSDPSTADDTKTWTGIQLEKMVQSQTTAKSIIHDVAKRVGIPSSKVITSNLNTDQITGYVVQNPTPARKIIDDLVKVFLFDITESDGAIKAQSRGGQSVVTIPQKDLGIIQGDSSNIDNPHDYYKETRLQEVDLPQTVSVTYLDPKEDYQNSTQHVRRPRSPMPVMQSRDKLDVNLPMAMKADFAKQLAEKILYSSWAERVAYEVVLPWKYLKYDPGDVITFQMDNGLTFETRMSTMDIGADLTIQAEGVGQNNATYSSNAKGTARGGIVPNFTPTPYTEALVLDLPYLMDSNVAPNSNFQFLVGPKALDNGFRLGDISYKNKGSQESAGTFESDVVWGTVSGLTKPPLGAATDVTTRLNISPAYDFAAADKYTFTSIQDADWPDDAANNTLITDGEVIYFKNVTANADGTYTLDTLIRGARGTMPFAYKHSTQSKLFVIHTAALQPVNEDYTYLNGFTSFSADAPGSLLPSTSTMIDFDALSEKPYAPASFKRVDNGGDIVISWERQTRLNGALKNQTGVVPLNEEEERYELFIVSNGLGDLTQFNPDISSHYVRHVENLRSNNYTYSAADILSDGVSKEPLRVVVYQMSTHAGRGFPGWATLWTP